MTNGYVVVLNRDGFHPIRHIIAIRESYNEEEFRDWYYNKEKFARLDGDEFIYCSTSEAVMDFINKA